MACKKSLSIYFKILNSIKFLLHKVDQAGYGFTFNYNRYMILRNVVTQQTQLKKILITLCDSYPLKCSKQNISGFFSNDRVIVVRGEYFQYYNCPSKFKDGNMTLLTENNFKARVKLQDIYELAFLPEDSVDKRIMMLSIPLNKVTATNIQLYKSKVSQKNQKQAKNADNFIINWIFKFNFDVKAEIFKKLMQEQRIKKQKQKKIVKYDPEQDLADSILNNTKNFNEKQENQNALVDLDKNIQKLKEMKQFFEFKQKLQKQEQERQNAIKLSLSLRKQQQGQNMQNVEEQQVQQLFPIRQAWKDYWKAYEKVSKYIGQAVSKQYLQKQLTVLHQINKIEAEVKLIVTEYINFKLVGWTPERISFDDYELYKGIWIKLGGKQLNQQFLSNYYLSDLMYIIKGSKKMKFRIPLIFFIKYKGFKALCMIDLPFSTIKGLNKQVYNIKAKSAMDPQITAKIKTNLEVYQKILNVKSQNYINGNYETNAPLGHDIKVFEYDNKFQDSSANYLQNFYYVTGVKGLFPIDYQFQHQRYHPQYCIRPQIIAEYRDFMESVYRQQNQLLIQAFKHSDIPVQMKEREQEKVVEVSQQFIPIKIQYLINEYNQINLVMIDSYSIKKNMNELGINSRYLGHMYKLTEIPYVQETLQIQMLSRIVKNIYTQSMKALVTDETFFKRQLYLKKHKQALMQTMKIHHDLMAASAIDFLNLVFGIGAETKNFWKIALQRCKQKYDIQFEYPLKVKSGCLLHAVLWHCKLIVNFQLDIPLFQSQKPFDLKKNWSDFSYQSKTFDFPSFQISKILKKLALIDDRSDSDNQLQKHIFELLKLQLLHHNSIFGADYRTQITIAKINNMGTQFEKPIRACSYHPSQLPYYFSNKNHQNFKKALDIINFSLASNHPMFISLYDAYSQQFQNQLLKKSTLLVAIKGLGEFHPRTTQLYSKYYRQGFQEFEVKAKRSQQTEAALTISQQLISKGKYETCMNFCFSRIQKTHKQKSQTKSNDLSMYLCILKYGLISAVKIRYYKRGLQIAEQYSQMINTYKIRTYEDHQVLLQHALIIRLNLTNQKFYLYKIVLLAIKIQQQFEPNLPVDSQGLKLPRDKIERSKILLAIMNEYYLHQTHSKWIQHIFNTLKKGYVYFNYLHDLFNNYKYHIKNYGLVQFQKALGYLDVLVRYFGQKIFHDCLYQGTT